MATDVVPSLKAEIETAFKTHTMADRQLARLSAKIRDGTATQIDGHDYAVRLGRDASKALTDVLTEANLPDGKLYYNIATRTVTPTLQTNQKLVNEAAEQILKSEDAKLGINLNSIKPKFPQERVQGLIDKMTADGITLDDALVWLKEPIINNVEAFFDDFVKENAEFRRDAGLKTKIVRTAESKACEWCLNLEGTYDYDSAPRELYMRHEFCRCSVTFVSERDRTSQNVWTKQKWKSTEEELNRRIGTKTETTTASDRLDRLKELENEKSNRRR